MTDSVSDIGKSPPIIAFCKDWDDDPTSNHHVLAELAKTRTVVWINSLGMRRPSLVSRSDRRRLLRKLRELLRRPRNVGDRLWVVTPVVLPFPQGYRDLRYNPAKGVLGIVTGVGTARAAASIMALGMDPRFDFSRAYWLVAGIAGAAIALA